jgi:hypothetical protein
MKRALGIAIITASMCLGVFVPIGISAEDPPILYGNAIWVVGGQGIPNLELIITDIDTSGYTVEYTDSNGNYLCYLEDITGFMEGDLIQISPQWTSLGNIDICHPQIATNADSSTHIYHFQLKAKVLNNVFKVADLSGQSMLDHVSASEWWAAGDHIDVPSGTDNLQLIAHNCYYDNGKDHNDHTITYAFYLESKKSADQFWTSSLPETGQYTIPDNGNPNSNYKIINRQIDGGGLWDFRMKMICTADWAGGTWTATTTVHTYTIHFN